MAPRVAPPLSALAAALAAAALAWPAGAQDGARRADPAAVSARSQLLVDRVLRLHACLTDARERAIEAQQILEQAQRVAADPSVGEAARRDARATVEAVDVRLRRIDAGVDRCLAEGGGGFALGDRPDPGVVYRDAPPDPAVESVGRDAPSLLVVEEDVVLRGPVRVVRGERVDGTGRAPASRVRRAVRDVAPAIVACWQGHVDRATARPGEASLVFRVAPDGRVRRARVEGSTISDRRFTRCLAAAVGELRVAGGVQGGEAVYGYRLRFGR